MGLSLSLPSKHTSKFLSQIFGKIQGPIDETKIKNSFYQLKRQGLIVYGLRLWQTPQITQAGKEKLKRLLPHYNNKRIWDKRLYLVSYDIPNSKKAVRDNLRQILKTLGCGLLQESVWLTPYNPKEVLKNFVAEHLIELLKPAREYFEKGEGKVIIDKVEHLVSDGFAVVVPSGAEHNIINTSATESLKLYTIYSPAHHRHGVVHITKQEAEKDDEHFDGKVSEE